MILADTSGLLALLDADDPAHRPAADFGRSRRATELIVPSAVIAELGYFMEKRLQPSVEAAVLRRLARAWRIEHFTAVDLLRAADLVERYADFPLGTVDALIVAMAERLGVTTIFTLDRRHFGSVEPAHCERFEIVP